MIARIGTPAISRPYPIGNRGKGTSAPPGGVPYSIGWEKQVKEHAAQVKAAAEKPVPKEEVQVKPLRRNLLSTGSTLLNLACSENPFGGFLKGKYYFLVGDSASGKTFLSMTCLAEAVRSKHFKDYLLVYDNVEDGCLMDIEGLFGEDVAERLQPPGDPDSKDPYSHTIEEFYYHLDDYIKAGKPFIYILDSMDALSSVAEEAKFDQHKKAHEEEKKVAGSYGDGKAKKNSEGLRKVMNGLRQTGSILIVLSQTRDNLGFGWETKTRSGGRALRFYATVELWSSISGKIEKGVRGKARQIGVNVLLECKKNRITGKLPEVTVQIYPSYGIDDIGSCVDYLVNEQWWAKEKNTILAKEFGFTGTREKLVSLIEEQDKVDELRAIVGACWKEIEDACSLKRRKKYQ